MKTEQVKAKADKVISFSDLPFGTLISNIAKAMIKEHGFYTYTDMRTNEKIFVQ